MSRGLEPYIEPGFLDPASCARIRAAMDRGAPEPAEILQNGVAMDQGVRSAWQLDVDPGTLAFVEGRLESRRERLSEWFSRPLTGREGAGFLRYGPGGFYRPHRDRGVDPEWPGAARRQVALVLFLTSADAAPGGDCQGGALRLLDGGDGRRDVEIAPTRGSLVAFAADTLHEVARVHAGTRDVVVDWFY
jgi:predicted 2-oxoglutarate/Fe(II)-dependent dioxygenase YbiX